MDKKEIIDKLLAGEMKLYQIDKYTENATEALEGSLLKNMLVLILNIWPITALI